MSMENPSSTSDTYYAQDDVSESIRHKGLVDEVENDNPWYDANLHGDFSDDGSP